MFTTDKPIIFRHTNVNYTNEFVRFHIAMDLWNATGNTIQTVTLFSGRTWFNADHQTEISLSNVLRDYTWKHDTVYDADKQVVVPVELYTGNTNYFLPIDRENRFYGGTAKIFINNTQAGSFQVISQNSTLNVDNVYNKPYDNNWGKVIGNNNPYTSTAIPHVPHVSTQKMWVGFDFAHRGESPTPNDSSIEFRLHYISDVYQLFKQGYGNFSFNLTLDAITNAIPVSATEKFQTVEMYAYKTPNRWIEKYDAFVLDNCPEDFYLFWENSFGFFSFGCSGRTRGTDQSNAFTMTDVRGIDRTLWNRNRYSWDLNTGLVSNEQIKAIATIMDAPTIWLYDTKKDRVWNVKVKSNTMKDGSDNGKMQNISITVEETLEHIS